MCIDSAGELTEEEIENIKTIIANPEAFHIPTWFLNRQKDMKTGKNIFASKDGAQSKLFLNHIGGLQRYLAAALSLCAPNVNSYRRLVPDSDAPTNVHWAVDNRTGSLRVPSSDASNTRVENRGPGADANP